MDHPRSRGVYDRAFRRINLWRGSSPLARGLRRGNHPRLPVVGIIPARAGFTLNAIRNNASVEDHPRSRGVYMIASDSGVRVRGSSPLARGLLPWIIPGISGTRIIPARAGFTNQRQDAGRATQDHPRSRGVYGSSFRIPFWKWGSSPLARGLRLPYARAEVRRRIIPARAGFTIARLG